MRRGPDVEAESLPSGRGNAEEEAGTAPPPYYRGSGLKPSSEAARKPRRRYADRRYAGADAVQAQSARNGRTRGSAQARWVEKEAPHLLPGLSSGVLSTRYVSGSSNHGRSAAGSATGRTPRLWTSPPPPKNARGRCDLFLSFFGRNSLDHSSYIWAKRLSVNLQTRLCVRVIKAG